MNRKRTVLMYGRSRAGKTAQLGELAEHVKMTTGLNSLIYSIDKGGTGPLMPLIELGVVTLIEQGDTSPWIFMNKLSNGFVRDDKGKWVKADLSKFGMVGCESMTGFSDAFMNDLATQAAAGVNIGGAANVGFTVNSDGESLKIGGNNMGHYNVVQNRILDEVWRSQRLPVPLVCWTASASRDEDPNASGKVIGPAIAGKALTAEMLRHFDLTFRLDCLPAAQGKQERHILYLGNSVDLAAGNAVGLGNTRVPLAEGVTPLPASIEPASVVKALGLIETCETQAKEIIKKRLEAGLKKV
jgi:hypothetical protein